MLCSKTISFTPTERAFNGQYDIHDKGTRASGHLRERQVRTCSDRRNARVRLKPSQEKKGQVVGSVREGWSCSVKPPYCQTTPNAAGSGQKAGQSRDRNCGRLPSVKVRSVRIIWPPLCSEVIPNVSKI
jgi:hypothetical protein